MTGLVGVIFVAIIGLFVYTTFSPGPAADHSNDIKDPIVETVPKATTTIDIENIDTTRPIDTHSAIDDCIKLKANEAKGKQYERGSLLVTFRNDIVYGLAIETMGLLDLKTEVSDEAENNFDTYHWLTVFVPSGQEFKWQCVLDTSEGVKKANLNIRFELRQ